MKAMKAVEIGDFYFKKENYNAAISRYRERWSSSPTTLRRPLNWQKC